MLGSMKDKKMKIINIEIINNKLLPAFGEKLNDERNSYRCSPPRRGESCGIKKQSARRV
jgi:hypothetical protein